MTTPQEASEDNDPTVIKNKYAEFIRELYNNSSQNEVFLKSLYKNLTEYQNAAVVMIEEFDGKMHSHVVVSIPDELPKKGKYIRGLGIGLCCTIICLPIGLDMLLRDYTKNYFLTEQFGKKMANHNIHTICKHDRYDDAIHLGREYIHKLPIMKCGSNAVIVVPRVWIPKLRQTFL